MSASFTLLKSRINSPSDSEKFFIWAFKLFLHLQYRKVPPLFLSLSYLSRLSDSFSPSLSILFLILFLFEPLDFPCYFQLSLNSSRLSLFPRLHYNISSLHLFYYYHPRLTFVFFALSKFGIVFLLTLKSSFCPF